MANWVISVFTDRSKAVMLKSMVRSRLEYSCLVWNPPLLSDNRKLESTQRAFTRHITGCNLQPAKDSTTGKGSNSSTWCPFREGVNAYERSSKVWPLMTSMSNLMNTYLSGHAVTFHHSHGILQPMLDPYTTHLLQWLVQSCGSSFLEVSPVLRP